MQPKPTPERTAHLAQPLVDLCANCIHRDNCHLRQMPTTPVYECNEHDDGTPEILPDASQLLSVPEATESDAAPVDDGIVGLCVNCDHRETCTLPRPAGGVWHCEEYQ